MTRSKSEKSKEAKGAKLVGGKTSNESLNDSKGSGEERVGTPRTGTIKHPPQTIARAIALLYLGYAVEEAARQTKLPESTVRTWRKYLPDDLAEPRAKKEVIEDLFLQHLEKGLKALLAQIEVASDPKWIKKQDAAALATLHGVLFDKLARVFDGAQRGAELHAAGQLTPAQPD